MDYRWQAILIDGSVINQFEDEIENTFKVVLDNKDKLKIFQLVSQDGQNRVYGIDMTTGQFNLNGLIIKSINSEKQEPIYWKRTHVIYSSETGGQPPKSVGYIIGHQVNIEGKNYQQQFMITPSGEITLLHKV